MPNVLGIKPENELPSKSSAESLEALKMKRGIVPLKLLPQKLSTSRFGSRTSAMDERHPERELFGMENSLSVDKLKIAAGTVPTNLL